MANAVLDGVDGILLGAETLRGKYPVEAVVTVSQTLRCHNQSVIGIILLLSFIMVAGPRDF